MDISYIAMNRMVENRMATDKRFRKAIEKSGKAVLSFGRKMSDDELLEKLKSFGLPMNKQAFEDLSKNFLSAEDMSEWTIHEHNLKFKGKEQDWIWICLTVLWERWLPHRPSLEMIDDNMQEGYRKLSEDDPGGACTTWLEVWKSILNIMDSRQMKALDDFDEKLKGTQSVHNWVQDLEMELGNAGIKGKRFLKERIAFCEEFIDRFAAREDSLAIKNMKRAIADSYHDLGETEKSDSLFQQCLKDDPEWGWGWIGWSDGYWLFTEGNKDYEKGEKILKEGLSVDGVRDRRDILERLETLYSETGREEDAREILREMSTLDKMSRGVTISKHGNALRVKTTFRSGEEGMPLKKSEGIQAVLQDKNPQEEVKGMKVGRNDPCPCGSGKKYKKCCAK